MHRYMTVESKLLSKVISFGGHKITFGYNSKSKIVGTRNIIYKTFVINYVLLVENLCYNLINISQLCENEYFVEFHKHPYTTKDVDVNIFY